MTDGWKSFRVIHAAGGDVNRPTVAIVPVRDRRAATTTESPDFGWGGVELHQFSVNAIPHVAAETPSLYSLGHVSMSPSTTAVTVDPGRLPGLWLARCNAR